MTNEEARAYFINCNERIISVAKDENEYNYETQQVKGVFARRTFEANELAIKALDQEPKTGYWVEENINEGGRKVFCSECGCPPPFEHVSDGDVYSASGYGVINKTKFCPNCGTKMVEPQERSNKE